MAHKITRNITSTTIEYTIIDGDKFATKSVTVPYDLETLESATAFLSARLKINGVASTIHKSTKRYEMSVETFIENAEKTIVKE